MIFAWIGFLLVVLLFLALDLGVFHRKAHVVSMKEALGWSGVWIACGLLFSGVVYMGYERHWLGMGALSANQQQILTQHASERGVAVQELPLDVRQSVYVDKWARSETNPHGLLDGSDAWSSYILGYVVEKSLSVDNIFVIAMIFSFLAVPAIYQHRVLFWGILGALLMRGVMIYLGAELIARYTWIIYVFGAFLIFTGIKMLLIKGEKDPTQNILVRTVKRFVPITDRYHGQHFFVRAGTDASHEAPVHGLAIEPDPAVERMEQIKRGALMMTPLFLALLLIEFTDLIFAVDSIPAIYGITTDPFLVFTSNVFAILGLRSLYFALAGMMDQFRYLKLALSIILMLVGAKMIFHSWLKAQLGEHFNFYMLGVILFILAAGVVGSMIFAPRYKAELAAEARG